VATLAASMWGEYPMIALMAAAGGLLVGLLWLKPWVDDYDETSD
jgi:hypothetical protein